ncbi:hypothetical protein [Streptomyces griseoloalbus]|uniref:PIN domain-containing protein n=1 Tax=Streptomyces griseoloalbus TaxID=67303 RepID=A0A7W8BPC2_9ACTN|nr:hypothetical protein [Streptomyces albaduncus]MBB5126975.1 hypothetical protein [Streptomyces albaduncus]
MDTSALVTWMTRRSHWGALDAFLQEWATEPLATSTLGFLETVRTLDLMGHFPKAMEAWTPGSPRSSSPGRCAMRRLRWSGA